MRVGAAAATTSPNPSPQAVIAASRPECRNEQRDGERARCLRGHHRRLHHAEDPAHHVVAGQPLGERERLDVHERPAHARPDDAGEDDHRARVEPDQRHRTREQRARPDVDRRQALAAHERAGESRAHDRADARDRRHVPDRALLAAEQVDRDDREEHVERAEQGDRPAQDRHDGKQPAVAEHRPQARAELGEQALRAGGRCFKDGQRTPRKWQDGRDRPERQQRVGTVDRGRTGRGDQQPGQQRAEERAEPFDRSRRRVRDRQLVRLLRDLGEERAVRRADERDARRGDGRHDVRHEWGSDHERHRGRRHREREDGIGRGEDLRPRPPVAEHRGRRGHDDRRDEHHAGHDACLGRAASRVGVHDDADPGRPFGDAEREERRDQPSQRRQPQDRADRSESAGHWP